MEVPVSEAKARLTELVKQAEGGDEVVLTRHGRPVVTLTPAGRSSVSERRALMNALRLAAAGKANDGPSAARSQDFLYDESGLPA